MNIQQLRRSLKEKWLQYYRDNREWLVKFGIWVDCDGVRRPTSGFILATLSVLEPRLTQLMPLVVDLSSSPDRVVASLGLNFSPDDVLASAKKAANEGAAVRLLPSSQASVMTAASVDSDAEWVVSGNIQPNSITSERIIESRIREDRSAPTATQRNSSTGSTKQPVLETNDTIAPPKTTTDKIETNLKSTPYSPAVTDVDGHINNAIAPTTDDCEPQSRPPHPDEQCSGRQSDETIWRSR